MQYLKHGDTYVIKIKKGEEAMAVLNAFCVEHDIAAGHISAIGAAEQVVCGYYDLAAREYRFQSYNELVEVVSFSGNVAMKEGKPFIHAHGVFSHADNSTFGGHVDTLRVGVVLEVVLTKLPDWLSRTYDEETGLFLLELPDGDK